MASTPPRKNRKMSNQTVISVQNFIEDNRPQEVNLRKMEVIVEFQKLGWEYVPNSRFRPGLGKRLTYSSHGEYLILGDESKFEYIKLGRDFTISYAEKLKEGKLVFSPLLRTPQRGGNMNHPPMPSPMDFGYGEVEVTPPEPIIELPVPPWVTMGGEWYNATLESNWLFESEAKAVTQKFIAQFSELGLT
jgi:hypothetical protein